MKPYRFTQAPQLFRRATLDNLTLVPGNLLPYKKIYQAIANQLPTGEILIVLPRGMHRQKTVFTRVVTLLQAKGHRVTTVPAERLDQQERQQSKLLVGSML